jgi:dTDP-L-rhamnose 4-epimerase
MSKGRALVTGGAGFIGSHTADELLRADYEVRVLDKLAPPVHRSANEWPDWLSKDVERIFGDVRNRDDWHKALQGVDVVFHLAAFQDLLPNFSQFFHVNSVGTALLYEVIVAEKLPVRKVVVASTQFVYGEGRYQCAKDGEVFPDGRDPQRLAKSLWEPVCPKCDGVIRPLPLLETHANPKNQYSIAKYSQELMAIALGRNYSIPSVALRYSIVQGPHQSFRNAYSGVLRIFTLQMMNGRAPSVFEDGKQLRDYVNVSDVARANLLALEHDEANYEVFNVGGGQGYTVLEFAQIVAEALNKEFNPSVAGEYRVGDTRHSVSDISKLQQLGWQPTKTPRDSVRDYTEWIRQQELDKDYAAEALATLRKTGALRKASGMEPESALDLSVVIPAYNEQERLRKHVSGIVAYLSGKDLRFEIVVVNDGSNDDTAGVTRELAKIYPMVRLVDLQPNRGKGGAVKAGMLDARGCYVLFTDADQSTPIGEVDKLLAKLEHDGYDMAIGSRSVPGAEVEEPQVWYRTLAGKLFGVGTRLLCVRGFHDTQCGFKAMKREVAQKVFPQVTSTTAIFDIEILVVAAREGYQVAEVPVKWVHDPDTRIPYNLRRALRIWGELFRIRRAHRVGWSLKVRK